MFGGGFPFGGDFPGFSHGHGGGGGRSTCDNKFYELLDVEKNATEKEIKRAYKKAAMKHHPDRGGDEETFKKLEKAKDTLLDPDKRRIYDRFGEEGLDKGGGGGGGGGGGLFDLFNQGPSRSRGPRKPKPVQQTIDIKLEDVYKGPSVERTWKIKTASGRKVCPECDGRGMVRQLLRQGSMMLQTQRPCSNCEGKGSSLQNEKMVQKKDKVHIPHGIRTGGKVTLSGEGHKLPDFAAGDVVFTVRVAKHPVFTRDGADIGMEQTITLTEALCGYEIDVKHLSGKTIRFKSKPGEVVYPGDLRVLKSYGLPQKGNRFKQGNLYLRFKILFPPTGSLDATQIQTLEKTLEGVEYPEPEDESGELGIGSPVEVNLSANAAFRIYQVREEMVVPGIICDNKLEDRDAWPVELNPRNKADEESKTVVVPAAWVNAAKPKSRRSSSSRRRKGSNSNSNPQSEEKDKSEEDDEVEEVGLDDVENNKRPKATPASGGQAAQEEEEQEDQEGGVQCQQM